MIVLSKSCVIKVLGMLAKSFSSDTSNFFLYVLPIYKTFNIILCKSLWTF